MINTERIQWPVVLKVEDVQKILGIGKNNAYNLFHRPDFPSRRVGRILRVGRDAFFIWLEKSKEN